MIICHFWAQKWDFFFRKNINTIFMYLLAPFIVQNFKNIRRANPKLWGCAIFRPKMACLLWKIIFLRKSISKPCRVHSCLSTCKKSELGANPLIRYCQLKNTEIWLIESIFCYLLKTRFFPHMRFLQNAKGS